MRWLDRRRAVTEGYVDSRSLRCTPHLRDCLAGVLRRLRSAPYDERGFSLPELLLVCVIVGVPAAIAIRSFASQKDKAVDTQAKALARAAQTAAETIGTDNSGSYETVTGAELNKYEPSIRIVASTSDVYLSTATGPRANTRRPRKRATATNSGSAATHSVK